MSSRQGLNFKGVLKMFDQIFGSVGFAIMLGFAFGVLYSFVNKIW
jgi:hypothetical protein